MRGMPWIKHFADASESEGLNAMMEDMGIESYARYWLLLELLTSEYKGESFFKIHESKIMRKLRFKRVDKMHHFLDKLALNVSLEVSYIDHSVGIKFDKIIELLSKDERYRRKQRTLDIRSKKEDIDKEKNTTTTTAKTENLEIFENKKPAEKVYFDYQKEICVGLKESGMLDKWKSHYPKIEVKEQITKAIDYLIIDYKEKGKECDNLLKFLNGWMRRCQ